MTKTKSKHHKNENTFKFQPLSERLKEIKVEIGRNITRDVKKPEETETYFYNALEKWVDLNYTALFYEFALKVKKNCRTLAMLIFNKDILVDTLIEFIGKADELSIQPLLDLTVQMSRDLQNDFYPYFPRIFKAIIQLLDTQNTDILEWSFQSLSYLFKFLWRYMLNDLNNVYELYSPLFHESRKEYIRNFAAESFAFLMRKIVDKNTLFDFLLIRLINHPQESKGISQLIFGMFKGVKNQFNACTEKSLDILFSKLNFVSFEENLKIIRASDANRLQITDENRDDLNELVFTCIAKILESMALFTKKQFTGVVWKCIYNKIDVFKSNKESMTHLMLIINAFLEPNNCYLIEDLDLFIQNMEKISLMKIATVCNDRDKRFTECFFDLVEKVLLSSNLKFPIEKIGFLPELVYQTQYDCESICKLTRNLFEYSFFEKVIFPNLLKYFDVHTSTETKDVIHSSKNFEKELIELMSEYLVKHKKIITVDSSYLRQIVSSNEKSSQTFFENTIQEKNLAQFIRCLSAKKNDGLIQKLIKFISGEIKNSKIQNDVCIMAPILYQISPCQNYETNPVYQISQNTFKEIVTLTEELLTTTPKERVNTMESNTIVLEKNSLLLSLSVWSLMMLDNNEKFLAKNSPISLKNIFDLLNNLEKLKFEIILGKSARLLSIEKSFVNIFRAVYYCLMVNMKTSSDKFHDNPELKMELLDPLHKSLDLLKNQLSSPYHENRLNSLNMINELAKCTLIKKEMANTSNQSDAENDEENIFINCLNAELTTASLDDYRQKLIFLQRLDPDSCTKYFASMNSKYECQLTDVPMRYLFGVLFENFKLLWEPITSLIQLYANSLKMDAFWSVFGKYFSHLSDIIESEKHVCDMKAKETNEKCDEFSFELEKFSSLMLDLNQNVDFLNVRYLLCKAMQGFTNSCESKTRLLVPLFFRFINNEYYSVETRLNSQSFDDLLSKTKKEEKSAKSRQFTNRALLNKYLCGYLDIFAKFTSPTSWFMENSLHSLFLNLLCHNESAVQKSALSCLDPYKYAFLKPYKSNFEKLLEGKTLRHELVVFSLEEKTGLVHADHRQKLLPILMRLLYGKFYSNETTHTSSRDTKTSKRTIIIQFLSVCNEYELNYFFNLLFDCLVQIIDDTKPDKKICLISNENISDQSDRYEVNSNESNPIIRDQYLSKLLISLNDIISDSSIYNLSKVIPLKKLLGILHSLEIIINKLARQMESFSHRILQIICFIHKYSFVLNDLINMEKNGEKAVDDYHTGLLRVIRQQATLRFKQFFDTFDHLNFSQQEHLLIMDSFIWPLSSKLTLESVKSVSNLMKIFSLWSERPYYYPLFAVKVRHFNMIQAESIQFINSDSFRSGFFKEKNVLDVLFELINSEKCSQNVIDYVMDMVYNLVSFADFKEEGQQKQREEVQKNELMDSKFFNLVNTKPLPFDLEIIKTEMNSQAVIHNDRASDINFGTYILKPHVGSIVDHIERIVTDNLSKKNLPSKLLKILARLSCFALNSAQQCEKIIQLLISYLIKNRKQAEDIEVNILDSISNLLKQVRCVGDFVCSLSRLFCVIKSRQSRVELCKVFMTIKDIDSSFETMAILVTDLNSWDTKRIEEPDYLRRLEAFQVLNKLVVDWTTFDIKLASVLVYNCFFFMNNIDDLALKESSTNCIREFLKKSVSMDLSKSEKALFESNFISEIKNGLRNKNENARHEFVRVLVEFIRLFKHMFTKYEELSSLMDTEDIERDFFENIIHIQMHRRSRALKRLQRLCDDKKLSSDNLLSFIMPLVRSFLDNEMYHKYDYLIEEACNSIGAICYILAWPKYLKIIEYYLKILHQPVMNQKLVIKVLVSTLDAFHFDLSNSNVTDYYSDKFNESDDDEDDEKENVDVTDKKSDEIDEKESSKSNERTPRVKQLVSKSLAFKIHTTVTKSVLPTLFKCLTKKLTSEGEIKMNQKDDMDEQILRVPMALAILKLLKNLPSKTFEIHLPGLLYKICDMLKSRAISVRNTTRECLIKMINELPDKKYYYYVFKELSNSLTRGYQVHVLCYTVQMILKQIEPGLKEGDLDSSLQTLVNGCCLELFSDVSEEKEERKIIAKTPEAKQMSSFNTLETLSQYISSTHVLELLKPFKQKLDDCNSNKLLKKIEESLKRISAGILKNTSLNTETLLMFIYGLVNDTFDALKNPEMYKKGIKFSNINKKEASIAGEEYSCLLLPIEPRRGGEKPKVQTRTNQHVIVEFALYLMNSMIKSTRVNIEHSKMLDPYIPIFVEYLEGKYVKLTIISLRCLIGFLKFNLQTLSQYSNQIANKLFALLQTYSSSTSLSTDSSRSSNNLSSGDNFELLMICFKVIANLIRDCTNFLLNEDQLKVLMHYAERNLYDNSKQSSAFNLIKAILSRRLKCDELTDVLGKMMKLSIQSESANVRLQSRQTILQYILEYSLGEKKLIKFLEFYIVQLNYEYENGRESALEMLATIFNTFPTEKLNEYSARFFLPLAIQLHNDESAKCKKLAYMALKLLIEKIGVEKTDALFNLTLALLKDDAKALHKRIAVLLIKVFVEVEGEKFEKRMSFVFDLLIAEIDYKNFSSNVEENLSGLVTEKFYDQYIFNLLTLIMKIYTDCKILNLSKYNEKSNQLYDQIQLYLIHDHLWVRLVSCQLFGLLFSTRKYDELFNNSDSFLRYSIDNVYLKIRSLVDAFVIQLKSPLLDDQLAEQIIKNLAFMSKIISRYPSVIVESEGNHDLNTEWLIKKIIKEAKYELVKKPNETIKRTYIFKWIAALTLDLGKDKIKDHLNLIIPSLQRETLLEKTTEKKFEDLKRLAQEVLEFIKQTIGTEEFSMIYSKSHMRRIENKEQRKRKEAQAAIVDPQLAAIKKIRKMQKKKEAKKRKHTNNHDGSKKLLKKKKFNMNDDDF